MDKELSSCTRGSSSLSTAQSSPNAPSPFLTEEATAADAYLERMTAREIEQGTGARSEMRHGIAAREIAAMAQPGDLLVLATHGRGGVARWFLGSVAEGVLRRSPVPVLMIRITADHNDPKSRAAS